MVTATNESISTLDGDIYLGRVGGVGGGGPTAPTEFSNMLILGHSLIGDNFTAPILSHLAAQVGVTLTTSQKIIIGSGGLTNQMDDPFPPWGPQFNWQTDLVTPQLDCMLTISTNPINGNNRDGTGETDLTQMNNANSIRGAFNILNSQKVNPTDPDKTMFYIETWRNTAYYGDEGDWANNTPEWPVLTPPDWEAQTLGTDQANQIIIRDAIVSEGHDLRMVWVGSMLVELKQLLDANPTHFGSSINFHTDILGDGVHLGRTGVTDNPPNAGALFARWVFCWIVFTHIYNRTPEGLTDAGATGGTGPVNMHPWITEQTKTNIQQWIWDRYTTTYRDL